MPRPLRIKYALPETINPTARSNPHTLMGSKFELRTKTGLSIIPMIIALSAGGNGYQIMRVDILSYCYRNARKDLRRGILCRYLYCSTGII